MARLYLVSDEHRFVYFIVPKVACTSVQTALLPLFSSDASGKEQLVQEDGIPIVPRENKHQREWGPWSSPESSGSGTQVSVRPNRSLLSRSARTNGTNKRRFLKGLQSDRYEGYFKFAFVRNPWDRLLSCYLQKIAPGAQGLSRYDFGGVELRYGMPFGEFVEAVHQIPDKEADMHFRSQHAIVCGPNDVMMADFVGRFENLEEDFAHVARRIGASRLKLPHLLPSPAREARPYRDYYDDETAERVGERFCKDAEIFGYTF